MGKNYALALFAIIIAVISGGCSKDAPMPKVTIIVGDKVDCKNGRTQKLTSGYILQENDTVIVAENSKLKLALHSGAIYLNSKSCIRMGSVAKQGDAYRFTIHLLEGELFFAQPQQSGKEDSYLFVIDEFTATTSINNLGIQYCHDTPELRMISISGSVLITSHRSEERFIAACNRFVSVGDKKSSTESISREDVNRLGDWVGKSTIDDALALSKCTPQELLIKNHPPEWVVLPDEVYIAGKLVIDTVKADDPESGQVTYELLSGPEGMTVDKNSGEIKFLPIIEGNVNVTIRAIDSDLQTSVLDHVVTISSELAVFLSAPRIVTPNEKFNISAAFPKNIAKKANGLAYRFDCNGDGIFEFPGSGKFGNKSRVKGCSFTKEGAYFLRIEVRNAEGKTASSKRKIIVNHKPKAVLKVTPSVGTTKTDYLLDASDCSDSRDSSGHLMVRFDIDNDGKWDIPSHSGFLSEKRAGCNWNETGKYRVVVQVIDKHGLTDTTSAEIIVTNGLNIDTIVCPDTVHTGDTVSIHCKLNESEFQVNKFGWSLDADTGYEISTDKPVIKHVFIDAGEIFIRCRAFDKEKGLSGSQKKKIVIVNNVCTIDAGGPYKTSINTTFNLEGVAKDADNKIVKYSWDFDNDGKPDWISQQTGKTNHEFKRSGTKKVVFIAETDDGSKVMDTAIVEIHNTPGKAIAGEDIVSRKGKKVKLTGIGQDSDGIIMYRWDFDNDGKIDWESAENGMVEKEFQSYTTAVFSIIDSDSSIKFDSIKIIICPEGMRTMEKEKYCIDIYEYPNKKNEAPLTDVTYEQAIEKCKQAGKRLCSENEWKNACRNAQEKNNFPYGKNFIKDKCNTLGNPMVKNKVSSSGFFLGCIGDAGVFDMSGNVAEWTESANGDPFVYGGSWQSDENTSTCDSKLQLKSGIKYFYVGLRCCK